MNRRLFGRLRWWGGAVLLAGVLLSAAHWGITPRGNDSRSAVSLATLLTCVLTATATGPTREPPDATAEVPGSGCGAVTSDRVDTIWISEC